MSLNETITSVIRSMVPGIVRDLAPSLRYATVDSVDPIRIRYDTEDAPSAVTPETLVPVVEGDRVRVMKYNRRATIAGVLDPYKEHRLTLLNNWEGYAGFGAPRAIRQGNLVTLHGVVRRGDWSSGDLVTFAQLPSGFRPSETLLLPAFATSGGHVIDMRVSSSGSLRFRASGSSPSWITLSGANFPIT